MDTSGQSQEAAGNGPSLWPQDRAPHAPADAASAGKATRLAPLFLAFRRGLPFAGIQRDIDQDQPLDPEKTWRLWTERKNWLFEWLAAQWPPRAWRRAYLERMLRQDHAAGIEAHYDVSNEFYGLWLDRAYRFYSCARFASPRDTLEQAQRNKADYLCTLLDPRAGERILDLGCGWGGMMQAIRATTGDSDHLLGISLSRPQVSFVRSTLGLRCEHDNFIHREYAPNSWDKIYSIGSMEHVRPGEVLALHHKLFRALPPGGRVVHQFFSTDRDPHSTCMVALQHFFPGTVLSRHRDMLAAMTGAGFTIEVDTTDDYRPTLRAWFDNLVAHKDAALGLVGAHVYNKYLVFFATSCRFFHDGHARLHRLLLTRP